MFILTMADGRKGEGLSAGVVCWVKFVAWVKGIGDGVWSVGSSLLRGSKELSAACGLSGQVWQVGQENCRRRLVCRGEKGEWVKRIVGGYGLSGQVWRVGQRNWRRRVVCRVKYGEWVKRIVGGVWSVGTSLMRGSRGLSAGVVCRVKYGEWVKRIVGGVWSVGAKRASGSRGLSAAFGLSARKRRVNQRNHTYRMPQTSQIATQIKIAKTLKT